MTGGKKTAHHKAAAGKKGSHGFKKRFIHFTAERDFQLQKQMKALMQDTHRAEPESKPVQKCLCLLLEKFERTKSGSHKASQLVPLFKRELKLGEHHIKTSHT